MEMSFEMKKKLKHIFHRINYNLDILDRIMKLININIVKSILNYRFQPICDEQNFYKYYMFFSNSNLVERHPFFNCFISNCELYNVYYNRPIEIDCGYYCELEMLNSSYYKCIFNLKNQDLNKMKIMNLKFLKILKIYICHNNPNRDIINFYKFSIKDENHIYRGIKNCIFKYKIYKIEHKKLLKNNINSKMFFEESLMRPYSYYNRFHAILERTANAFNICINLK